MPTFVETEDPVRKASNTRQRSSSQTQSQNPRSQGPTTNRSKLHQQGHQGRARSTDVSACDLESDCGQPLEMSQLVHAFCQSDWGVIDSWVMTQLCRLNRWFQRQRF